MFEDSNGPDIDYYLEWIKRTRNEFPGMDIVAGPWVNRVGHISSMLDAGANAITKFPAIKLFNTNHAKTIEEEINKNNYKLIGTLTKIPIIDSREIKKLKFENQLKKDIIEKIEQYLRYMNKDLT